MIDLYYWNTPNGNKILIFLEEAGLPYRLHPVNIKTGEQFKPEFLAISPNNKIPAIVDNEPGDNKGGLSVFESGAILWYLADKVNKFIPSDLRAKVEVSEWLSWQIAGLGPMAGQNHHFNHYAPEKIAYGIKRYTEETTRLYGVLERQLTGKDYVAHDYSIADMAIYPWLALHQHQKQNIDDFPNIKRWLNQISLRPAVVKAYEVAKSASA